MKLNKHSLVLLMLLISTVVFSENPKKISVKIEFGVGPVTTTDNKAWNIRRDVGMYYYDYNNSYSYNSSSVYPDVLLTQFAVKPEISFFDDKLALSSGLCINVLNSSLSPIIYSINDESYFYLRYNSTNLLTEYAKVKSISETTSYLGIPIDIKFSPFSFWKMDFFLKTGVDVNYKLASNTNLDFYNESMASEEQAILDKVGLNTNKFLSIWTTSMGVSFGNKEKLRYNIEYILPSVILTKNNSTIANANMFVGFKCSVQFNLNKSNVK